MKGEYQFEFAAHRNEIRPEECVCVCPRKKTAANVPGRSSAQPAKRNAASAVLPVTDEPGPWRALSGLDASDLEASRHRLLRVDGSGYPNLRLYTHRRRASSQKLAIA